MLKVPAEFPYAGSEAVFDQTRVRIVRHLDGGPNGPRAFISGRGKHGTIARVVELSRLRPFAESRAGLDLWTDHRIFDVGGKAFTSARAAWADFQDWYCRTYQVDAPPLSPITFHEALAQRGFVAVHHSRVKGWRFALLADASAGRAA